MNNAPQNSALFNPPPVVSPTPKQPTQTPAPIVASCPLSPVVTQPTSPTSQTNVTNLLTVTEEDTCTVEIYATTAVRPELGESDSEESDSNGETHEETKGQGLATTQVANDTTAVSATSPQVASATGTVTQPQGAIQTADTRERRPTAKKPFFLPCHYGPAFGTTRMSKGIVRVQEKHGVVFEIVYQSGGRVPLSSLCKKNCFKIFTEHSTKTGESSIPQAGHLAQFLIASPMTCFRWLWQDDQGGFTLFESQLHSLLEANYKDEGSFQCKVSNGFEYAIDFASMTQTNIQTGRKRAIKYEAVSIEWQYKNKTGTFVSHTWDDSAAIERMSVAGKPMPLAIGGTAFTFDFINMRQIDASKSEACTIRRCAVLCRRATAAYELTLEVEGPKDNLDAAIADLITEIRTLIHIKEHKIDESDIKSSTASSDASSSPMLNRIVQAVLLQKTRLYAVSSLITANTVELHGIKDQIDKVMVLLQEILLNVQRKVKRFLKVPEHWSPQSHEVDTMKVPMGSDEWNHVQSLVYATLPQAQILALHRVQNRWLWEKYDFAKQRLAKKE